MEVFGGISLYFAPKKESPEPYYIDIFQSKSLIFFSYPLAHDKDGTFKFKYYGGKFDTLKMNVIDSWSTV